MVSNLKLNSVNSHLPLRERIRVAMMEQFRIELRATKATTLEPHDMCRLKMAAENLGLLLDCRTHYVEHLTRMPLPQSSHVDAMANLDSQIETAEKILFSIEVELFRVDCLEPNPLEIAAMMHAYLRSLVDSSAAQHPSVQRLLSDPFAGSVFCQT